MAAVGEMCAVGETYVSSMVFKVRSDETISFGEDLAGSSEARRGGRMPEWIRCTMYASPPVIKPYPNNCQRSLLPRSQKPPLREYSKRLSLIDEKRGGGQSKVWFVFVISSRRMHRWARGEPEAGEVVSVHTICQAADDDASFDLHIEPGAGMQAVVDVGEDSNQ